jgi:hypothetical protein
MITSPKQGPTPQHADSFLAGEDDTSGGKDNVQVQNHASGSSTNDQSVSSASQGFYSNLTIRDMDHSKDHYDAPAIVRSVPNELRMDYSRIINKPFLVKTLRWSTADAQFSNLDVNNRFPYDYINALSNDLLKVPFRASALYRMKACLMIQVSGTAMHQGTVAVSASPFGINANSRSLFNHAMAAPHAFLNANNSTAVCVPIPFYSNQTLSDCNVDNNVPLPDVTEGNYASINFIVLNPLVAPTSGSTEVTITVHLIFEQADFYVPHVDPVYIESGFSSWSSFASSYIDSLFGGIKTYATKFTGDLLDLTRGTIRSYTGLHNNNSSKLDDRKIVGTRNFQNIVDSGTAFEKLDPYSNFSRITAEPIFETCIDEMDMKYILSKPYYIDTFRLRNSNATGDLLFSRPITPVQENILVPDGLQRVQIFSMPLQRLAYLSRYWRGSLKLHIQANMTNFHYAKLTIARDYSPPVQALTQNPSYDSIQNLLVDTIEFSAGGQIQTVDLPYCSSWNQLECTTSWEVNALQHGMYYIYSTQPLIVNGSVSQEVNFNVYLSAGDDFEFYGYSTNNFRTRFDEQPLPTLSNAVPTTDPVNRASTGIDVQSEVTRQENYRQFFRESAEVPMSVPGQADLQPKDVKTTSDPVHTNYFKPVYSVRDYMRRLTPKQTFEIDTTQLQANNYLQLSVSELLGLSYGITTDPDSNSLGEIQKMFLGYAGGGKFKIRIIGNADVKAYFVPPGSIYNRSIGIRAANFTPSLNAIASNLVIDGLNEKTAYCPMDINFPLNSQEFTTVYKSGMSSISLSREFTTGDYQSSNVTEIEIEIPNYSRYRFVGSFMKGRLAQPNSEELYLPDNLGYIVISYRREHLASALSTEAALSKLCFEIFTASSDEGRAGFNCVAFPSRLRYIVAPTGLEVQVSPFNTGVATFSDYASSLAVSSDAAPRAYFTN